MYDGYKSELTKWMRVCGFDHDARLIRDARETASRFPRVRSEFWQAKAEFADISPATHLYMYYPFRHEVHDQFMKRVAEVVHAGEDSNFSSPPCPSRRLNLKPAVPEFSAVAPTCFDTDLFQILRQ